MRSLLYIVILLVVSGCSYSSQCCKALDEAAALIQSDPSAAMDKLNNCDVSQFNDSATLARWALLYSEALVANKIIAPTDTIVNIAIDYYGSHNLNDEFRHASRLKAILKSGGEANKLGEALYLQKEKEFMLYKERIRHQQILFGSIMALLIALGIILWQRQRIKIKDANNMALIAEASALMSSLKHQECECTDLQLKMQSVFNNRFSTIDRLCDTYYETQGTNTERQAIVKQVKAEIDELKSDSGLFAEMESCVNNCNDGILDKLRNDISLLKVEDYRLAVYLASNLSNRTIAVLMGENMNVIYKRKSRLKAKISAIDSPNKAQYLSIF
ncbi:MAG: hypothetical protein K2J74_03845 [Muribaculaceae bacterium]|nr:hypothetical protein [Muribaculaceae bacterium]